MKNVLVVAMTAAMVFDAGAAASPVDVRVRQTPQGPRIFVDGKAVRPRFYYGSPPCLCPISNVKKREFTIPFCPEADTDKGRVSIDGFADDAPMWFSNAALIDKTDNKMLPLPAAGGSIETDMPDGEERTRHFVRESVHGVRPHGRTAISPASSSRPTTPTAAWKFDFRPPLDKQKRNSVEYVSLGDEAPWAEKHGRDETETEEQ